MAAWTSWTHETWCFASLIIQVFITFFTRRSHLFQLIFSIFSLPHIAWWFTYWEPPFLGSESNLFKHARARNLRHGLLARPSKRMLERTFSFIFTSRRTGAAPFLPIALDISYLPRAEMPSLLPYAHYRAWKSHSINAAFMHWLLLSYRQKWPPPPLSFCRVSYRLSLFPAWAQDDFRWRYGFITVLLSWRSRIPLR